MTNQIVPVSRSPRYESFLTEMTDPGKTILIDGPISTELDSRGITMASGRERRVAKDDPESLVQVHMDYIDAGARVITTNTFGRTRQVLGTDFEDLTNAAVECALEARKRTGTEDSVIIAGSLAYHTAQGPGKYEPMQDLESWESDIGDLVELLKNSGVDIMLPEWSVDLLSPFLLSGLSKLSVCLSGLVSRPIRTRRPIIYVFSIMLGLPSTTLCQILSGSPLKALKDSLGMGETVV